MKKIKKGLFFMGLCLTLLVVFYVSIHAGAFQNEQNKLEKIRATIIEKGAKWQAGETSMGMLSPEERRKRLGALIPQIEDPKKMISFGPFISTPDKIDWRNYLGENFITSVKNQG